MLHCETSHVTMWATFMTITRWRWRPIAFREKRSVKKYYWITDITPWKTCTFTCSRVVVVYVVFVVDLFLFVEDFDSCSVIVSIKLIKIRNRTAITYVTYVVHAAQGRSERGCGGASPPPPPPPNNMSQLAKSANYTHTSIRISKTEKVDKDYVLWWQQLHNI